MALFFFWTFFFLIHILRGDTQSPEKIVYQRTVDIFYQKSLTEIEKDGSKLRTYKLVKKEIREEPYLTKVKNVKDRISLTKFRLSNHKLMIEKGRHFKLEKSARKCPFCSSFENEAHFLLKCKTFSALRERLFTDVTSKIETFYWSNDQQKLIILMGNLDVAPSVAKYLTRTMQLRDFLMSNPKQLA